MVGQGKIKVENYTQEELERIFNRIWDRINQYSGYQPFG
jgi:hypothetical protein